MKAKSRHAPSFCKN